MKQSILLIMLALACVGILSAQTPTTVNFAGMIWKVKDSGTGTMGPGNNYWSPDGVWVDNYGQLHLKIRYDNTLGQWTCAEVWTETPADYGDFTFTIYEPQQTEDVNVVFGTFLLNNIDVDPELYELDIEFSKWGCSCYPNTGFSIHNDPVASLDTDPEWHFATNLDNKGSYYSSKIGWQQDEVSFSVSKQNIPNPGKSLGSGIGNAGNGQVLAGLVYNSDVPGFDASIIPDKNNVDMYMRINYWLLNATPPADGLEREIVIRNVSYPTTSGKSATAIQETTSDPSNGSISDNYPNPFGTATLIDIQLPERTENAALHIYDESGKEVEVIDIKDKTQTTVEFSKGRLSAGVYVYALMVNGVRVDSKKMIIE